MRACITIVVAAVLLVGCQSLQPQPKKKPLSPKQAAAMDPYRQILTAGPFEMDLKTPGPGQRALLRIYMDMRPDISADPRRQGLAWRLFRQDNGSFYAHFPCVRNFQSGVCDQRYRGRQRYATEQAEAVAQMLDQLKRQRHATTLEIVAIGGAAPLMLKAAALGGDVDHLHTVDGILSPAIQARQQGQAAPVTSDPLIYYRQLREQPQTHWISAASGEAQEALAQEYKDTLKQSTCVRLRIASSVKQVGDWLAVWPQLKNDRFHCRS
ncbi:MAG: hypothetical protein OIF57_12130 [Marinobacterium sp.]|nr:hypothetical protein [Marinobacterium sp.]